MTQLAPSPALPETKMCDRDPSKVATHAYSWDWGEKGVCCAEQVTILQQIAQQVGRGVLITPLQDVPVPMGRDERAQLLARALVAEEEIEVVKARGLELYRANQQIHAELKLAKVREAEAHAQMVDALAKLQRLDSQLQARDREHARLADEVERLRLLEAFTPGPGEPPVHVVEGDEGPPPTQP